MQLPQTDPTSVPTVANQPCRYNCSTHPTHGIAEASRATQTCTRKTQANPQTMVSLKRPNRGSPNQQGTTFSHNLRRYRQSVHAPSRIAPTVGNLPAIILRTHRMVSPKRLERSDQPKHGLPTTRHRPPHGVARSVPRDWPTHVRMTLARPEDQGVTGVSRDRQRPPQSLLECAAPGRSSQCGSRESLGFPITHNKDGPSWSVRLLAAPRSVGPTVVGSDNTLVPLGVCGTWPLLAVWDPRCLLKQLRPSVQQTSELHECVHHKTLYSSLRRVQSCQTLFGLRKVGCRRN